MNGRCWLAAVVALMAWMAACHAPAMARPADAGDGAGPATRSATAPAATRPSADRNRRLPRITMKDVPLGDALSLLADAAAADLLVDWKALEAAGVTPKSPVHYQATDVTASEALAGALASVKGEKRPIRQALVNDILLVSTPNRLARWQAAMKSPDDSTLDPAMRLALNRKLPEFKLDNVGLRDVIDFLRDVTSAPIEVDWKALEKAGVDESAPITLTARERSLRQVMAMIAIAVEEKEPLAVAVEKGKIRLHLATPAAP